MKYPAYDRYKDSGVPWLGDIPEGWEVKPMKRCLSIQNGRDYKDVESETGYPVIGSGGQFTFASEYLYNGEAVLLGRKGTIDKPLYINSAFWTVDTMYYAIPKSNYSAKFLYYCALGIPFSLYSTDTALPSMTQTALGNHPIAAPSPAEQKAIAAFLDEKTAEIDALIAQKVTLLKALAEKRSAIITHAVTKGLNPAAPMKPSGVPWLGDIPEGWEVKPMKRCLSIQNGRDYKDVESETGYPVIGSGGQFTFASEYLYNGEAVLLGRKGTIDKPLYINSAFWTVDTMYYAIPKSNYSAKFLYYCALGIPFSLYSTDTALPSMTQTALGNHPIAAPSPAEQKAIAAFLDEKTAEIDSITHKIKDAIAKLKEYRTSLITNAVTGKVKVS